MRIERVTEYVRATIVSPESLVLIALFALAWSQPAVFKAVGATLRDIEAGLAWSIAVAPSVLLGLCYKQSRKLTRPKGRRSELVEWPDYWRLLVRIYVALGMSGLAAALMFVSLYLVHFGSTFLGGFAAVTSVTIAATSLATVALAQFKLEAYLDGALDP